MVNSRFSRSIPAQEVVIYTDESDKRGTYFSNFYGGALVRATHLNDVISTLERCKSDLNLGREVKWQKVTENYLTKYEELMDQFFDFIAGDMVKIRVMFTQNAVVPSNLTAEQKQNEYHLLYYQFLKHAFGLPWATNGGGNPIQIRVNLDQLPQQREQNYALKSFVLRLNQNPEFRTAKIRFMDDQIAEVESHHHVILQCLDVVLGSMCFRLNNKHLEKPAGKRFRGKRTVAKEKLYKFILCRIRQIYPNFNIGESTGTQGEISNRWNHPYRHWKFRSQEFELDETKFKPN